MVTTVATAATSPWTNQPVPPKGAVITLPFGDTSWFVQGLVAAVATVVTMPYGVLVGVLLYLDLRARKERLTLESLRADLQASAT